MLEVETIHQIMLLFYREGLSLRKIAKKLHIHRRTVKARIDQYEQFKRSPLSDQDKPKSLLNQYLRTGSVYDSSQFSQAQEPIAIVPYLPYYYCFELNTILVNKV